MVLVKLRRSFRTFYRRSGLVALMVVIILTGFMVFDNKLFKNYSEEPKTVLKMEEQLFAAKNDEPRFLEVVDDRKFVIKNLETNSPNESVKVIEIENDKGPVENTAVPKLIFQDMGKIENDKGPVENTAVPKRIFQDMGKIENDKGPVENTAVPKRIFQEMGKANVHVWDSLCSFTINTVRQFPLFPLRPKAKTKLEVTDELKSKLDGSWLAQRIMGFLHPPVSGKYQFELSSFLMSELWLSNGEDPAKSELISKISRNKLYDAYFSIGENSPKSSSVHLNNGSAYYFEIIHAINDVKTKEDHVRLLWKMPEFNDFTSIKKAHVSAFLVDEQQMTRNETQLKLKRSSSLNIVGEDDMSSETQHGFNMDVFRSIMSPYINTSSFHRDNVRNLPYWDRSDIKLAIHEAPYEPSYTRKREYKRYEGVYNTHFTDVFPNDDTLLRKDGYKDPTDRDGNLMIDEKEVFQILKIFMELIERRFPKKYLLEGIINVERNVDTEKGARYLLELVLRNIKQDKLYRIAEYVYKFKTQPTKLFRPKGLVWDPNVTINVILTVKNQGDWGINFIEEMSRIKELNDDKNLNFIIVDYGGDKIDMENELKQSILDKFTVIRRKGVFHKTSAINEAASKIKDPNSIVFLMDLHLHMPNNIFDSIRKHTMKGLMSFTPIVFRLQFCGRPGTWNSYGSGWWETSGYGLFSIYKSDWDNFGGMNVKEFTNKWGGEDWEMVDRVLAKQVEIERLRVPELYHFFHDKSKMWDKSG